MCGIVGHIGTKNTVEVIMDGLSRLEYRGYDSSGICFRGASGGFVQHKKAGKLQNLAAELKDKNYSSHLGIGHTRWATHGKVTDFNAHPHGNEQINLVHNGIIENFQELKNQLIEEGQRFDTETDTEVFLALVTKYRRAKAGEVVPLERAVVSAFKKIKGNSAFVVIDESNDKIVAVKKGAPLVCGKSSSGRDLFISSDPYALVGYAAEVFFPEDDVLCILEPATEEPLRFLELDHTATKRIFSQKQDKDLELSEKGPFDHYMLKEINEQSQLIRQFIDFYFHGDGRGILREFKGLHPRLFHISACGTAWHAGLCIKNFIEKNNQIPVHIDLASEFRYRNPLLSDQDIGLFISQSGETADTLAAQKLCREKGLKTISIVNVEGSTLFRDCDHNLIIKAGPEVGVASTKAFTLMVLTGYLFSHGLADRNVQELRPELEILAARIEGILSRSQEIQEVAYDIYQKKGFLFTGRGKYFPIALEGALKLKEIAYVHAEGYAAGELKHGPIALIDEDIVNVALVGPELYEKTLSNIEEVRARNGIILTIGPRGDRTLEGMSRHCLPLNFSGLDELSPLLVNVVLQLLAYHIARYKGTDIDRPRNLAKSVTVE